MALGGSNTLPREGGEGDGERMEAEISTFMSAGHMKMQPSLWLEKIAAIPMPYKE